MRPFFDTNILVYAFDEGEPEKMVLGSIRRSRQLSLSFREDLIVEVALAAGVLYPSFAIMLRPEWSALLMSLSSIIVAVNAVLLKGVEKDLDEPGSDIPRPRPAPAV